MKIDLQRIKIRDIAEGYRNDLEQGVYGYGDKLNIRPIYQREFVYGEKERNAVIDTVMKGYPLNVLYWVKSDDGTFEVLDGQQRTISICEYVKGLFSIDGLFFHSLPDDIQEKIYEYELMIYVCEGNHSEKLAWFETINIAGMVLSKQEIRNAIFAGPWVTHAKSYFSKTGCPAYMTANRYLSGKMNRQAFLETAIKWISKNNIRDYMSENQHNSSAVDMWNYFSSVISWVEATFKVYRKEMKGIEWAFLYDDFKDENLDPDKLELEINKLMEDDHVQKKKGIYEYVLRRDEKFLNIRAFTDQQKREMYERQGGLCNIRKKPYPIEEMEADHIDPWSEGGKTEIENGQMIHKEENRRKSNK